MMAKSRRKPRKRNPQAAALADPVFRKRVVPLKKVYNRNKLKGKLDGTDV